MNMKKYDGKPVRITGPDNEAYEGIASYCHEEYCEHEYGRNEPCLQLINFLFFRGDIRKIESLENKRTPYSRFSAPYGRIEELNASDGIDSITEQLWCEEDELVLRMLRCLEDRPDLGDIGGLAQVLRDLPKLTHDERCVCKAKSLLNRLDDNDFSPKKR